MLVAFFFQTFFYEQLSSLSTGAVQYKLERKIDFIYSIVKDNYSESNQKEKGAHFWSNPKTHSQYPYAEDNESIENVKTQTSWAKAILASIFALGSLLIIIGKYIEYSITKSKELSTLDANNP